MILRHKMNKTQLKLFRALTVLTSARIAVTVFHGLNAPLTVVEFNVPSTA